MENPVTKMPSPGEVQEEGMCIGKFKLLFFI